jgi:hypothetical protein
MSRQLLLCSVAAAIFTVPALPGRALADDVGQPFSDVPLTLKPLHFAADAALGFGTYVNTSGSTTVGWGSTFSAAVGLPFLGELGATIAERFGNDGIAVGTNQQGGGVTFPVPTGADHFGRLFDPIVGEPGLAPNSAFANPEFHLRGTMVPLDVFELGLETRVVVPTSDGSYWDFTPGVPIRIHIPGLMRIDTGLWLPIFFVQQQQQQALNLPSTVYILDIPAQAYFQIGSAFVGPQTGIRFNNIGSSPSSTDIPLGVGGGYTIGGILDIKAQLRMERLTWFNQSFGGGIGVGLRLP